MVEVFCEFLSRAITHPSSPPDHHILMEPLVVGWGGGAGGVRARQSGPRK